MLIILNSPSVSFNKIFICNISMYNVSNINADIFTDYCDGLGLPYRHHGDIDVTRDRHNIWTLRAGSYEASPRRGACSELTSTNACAPKTDG